MSARNSEIQLEEASLGYSTYEFIDTDEESRDENTTESVASTDLGRPDDVASLADTEHSGEESLEGERPEASLYSLIDQNFEGNLSAPTLKSNIAVAVDELENHVTQAIEFEEFYSLGAENVAVKHTIAEFDEERSKKTIESMAISTTAKRLALTIRLTMTKHGLSTRDPLRILYVGSHSAKQDIIHKIASSVTASAGSAQNSFSVGHSQLYNVVPVSAFGSERTPEIELMHSSGYQIKVEDCTAAQALIFEEQPKKPDVIKLILDGSLSYHSVPNGSSFAIEPAWELPHISIFYCSDSDDLNARRTTTIARKFMNRHGISSIIISHKQLLNKGHYYSLDQHSIHMCLESRDVDGRGNIIHRRLPIDLAAFLNIDARQMNRNIAYVTGLHDHREMVDSTPTASKITEVSINLPDLEKTKSENHYDTKISRRRSGAEWRALLPVGILLISVFAVICTNFRGLGFSSNPSISINSKIISAMQTPSTAFVATPTGVVAGTSTVDVSSITAVASQYSQCREQKSLSIIPQEDVGQKFPDADPRAKLANQSALCAAEILGSREILIRIPSPTKLSWLTKEAISINITRCLQTIDIERAYTSREGIVLLLPESEASGVLFVSVVTTRKPRINETLMVNFGGPLSLSWYAIKRQLLSLIVGEYPGAVIQEAYLRSQTVIEEMKGFGELALSNTVTAKDRISQILDLLLVEADVIRTTVTENFMNSLSKTKSTLGDTRQLLGEGVLRAQIQSKLLWLRFQGRKAEYDEYQRRAAEALNNLDGANRLE